MQRPRRFARRTILQLAGHLFCSSLAGRLLNAAPALSAVERVARQAPNGEASVSSRRYRVDATVGLLSIPIVSKQGVGGGIIVLEQTAAGNTRTTGIQLAAGSWPGRLKGFNRFGMTQEAIRQESGVVAESAYISFMTTSPEKTFREARAAFESQTGAMAFSVAHGRSTPSATIAGLEKISTPSSYTWTDSCTLLDTLGGRLAAPMQPAPQTGGGAVLTFLCACRESLLQGPGAREVVFAHNSKIYTLKSNVSQSGDSTALAGSILLNGRTESQFRAWFGPHDPLPLRFEFRPKSYLRLTFEHDPASSGPPFRTLFHQEPV